MTGVVVPRDVFDRANRLLEGIVLYSESATNQQAARETKAALEAALAAQPPMCADGWRLVPVGELEQLRRDSADCDYLQNVAGQVGPNRASALIAAAPKRCQARYAAAPAGYPGPCNPPVWCYLPEGHEGPHRCNSGGMHASYIMDERKIATPPRPDAKGGG